MPPLRKKNAIVICVLLVATMTFTGYYKLKNESVQNAMPLVKDFIFAQKADKHFQISPDGQRVAWQAFDGNATSVVIASLPTLNEIARFSNIAGKFMWAPDSKHLLFWQDIAGRQSGNLWLADTTNVQSPPRNITNLTQGSAGYVGSTGTGIFIEHNGYDRHVFDLYKLADINHANSTLQLVTKNPGNVVRWIVDKSGLRGTITQHASTRAFNLLNDKQLIIKTPLTWNLSDTFVPVGFDSKSNAFFFMSNMNADKVELRKITIATSAVETVYADKRVDVDVEENLPKIGSRSGQPLTVVTEPNYPLVKPLTDQLSRTLSVLLSQPARISILSITDDESQATAKVYNQSGTYHYLLNLMDASATILAKDNYASNLIAMARTEPIQFTSRDGLTLNGYLTRPTSNVAAIGKKNPMVVRIHGGPWYRNTWGNTDLDAAATQVQFLASRGYIVLEVNFRGSTGYGRLFKDSAIHEFGRKMQDDIIDGAQWAIKEGIADPTKIGIMGASYGGYATLMALSDESNHFACGIAASAPSNLTTMIEQFPAEWSQEMDDWYRFVGDPRIPTDRAKMLAVSPISHVNSIAKPLLLIHGEKDDLVALKQATDYVAALESLGKSATLLQFKDEGHTIASVDAQLAMYEKIETFFGNCLGGKMQQHGIFSLMSR